MIETIPTTSRKWTLVWDLDGTLVKSTDREPTTGYHVSQPITFYSEIAGEYQTVWTSFRPGFITLLQNLKQHGHQIGIWSAGQPGYVRAITKVLTEKSNVEPVFVYDWTRCERHQRQVYKPLRSCPTDHHRTLLIDDTIGVLDPDGHDNGQVVIVPTFNTKHPKPRHIRSCIVVNALQQMIRSLEKEDRIITLKPLQRPQTKRSPMGRVISTQIN